MLATQLPIFNPLLFEIVTESRKSIGIFPFDGGASDLVIHISLTLQNFCLQVVRAFDLDRGAIKAIPVMSSGQVQGNMGLFDVDIALHLHEGKADLSPAGKGRGGTAVVKDDLEFRIPFGQSLDRNPH